MFFINREVDFIEKYEKGGTFFVVSNEVLWLLDNLEERL